MELVKFASKESPLRSSQLPLFMACPWRQVMLWSKEFEDSVGAAADTGSAVHKAAETLHRYAKSYDDCIVEAKATEGKYPKVDWDEVRLFFRPYYEDPRNHGGKFLAIEEYYELTFENPQGETPVVISGHFDQIRTVQNENGNLINMLYDIKTGKSLDLFETLLHYTLQLACYRLGAEQLGYHIDKVGVIYLPNYRKRGVELPSPKGIFTEHSLQSLDECKLIMKGVINRVNMVRRGEIDVVPGYACSKCPARSPSVCLQIREHKVF